MLRTRLINLAFYVSFLLIGMIGALIGATLQYLARRYDVALENAGIFTSLDFATSTVAVLVIGRLYNHLNARVLLVVGPVLLGCALLLLALVPVQWVGLGAMLLFGLGYGALVVGPNVLVAVFNPHNATSALNLLNLFFGVGAILGPQLLNLALRLGDFTYAYLIAAALLLGLLPLLWQVDYQQRSAYHDTNTAPVAVHWPLMMPFALLLFLYVGAEVGYSAWITTQMTQVALARPEVAAVAVSIFWGGLTFGRAAATLIGQRVPGTRLLLGTIVVLGLGTGLVLAFPTSQAIALASAFIAGFGCGPVFPTTLAVVSQQYPRMFTAASGFIIAFGNLGAVALPWFQGRVGGGDDGGMIVVLSLSLLMLGIVLFILGQSRAQQRVTKETSALGA